MIRPVIWWMAAFVLGELSVYGQQRWLSALCWIWIVLLIGTGYLLNIWHIKKEKQNVKCIQSVVYAGLCLAFFLLGMNRMISFAEKCQVADSMGKDTHWHFAGMIDRVEEKSTFYYLYIKHGDIYREGTYLGDFSVCLLVEKESEIQTEYREGDWVRGSAANEKWNVARNEGNFHEKRYYRSLGVLLKGKINEIQELPRNFGIEKICGFVYRRLGEIREKFCGDIQKICDEKTAGAYEAILFGNKENLSKETKAFYQKSGLAHVICISGIHLSILGNGCYRLLRKRLGFLTSGSTCFIVMLAYTVMSGMQPSAVRAMIMFAMRLFADVLGRKYDIGNALSVAVLFLLWKNPEYYENAGFYLSVLSVFGIACLAPVWNVFLQIESRMGKAIHSSLVLTYVQLPVVAWNFYQVPVYGMALNLLVVPCMGLVVGCGVLGVMLEELIAGAGTVGIGLGVYLLRVFEYLSEWTWNLPASGWICGKPVFCHMVLYYLIGAFLFVAAWFICKRKTQTELFWYVRYGRRALGGLLVLCSVFILFWKKLPDLEVVYLDVGQGDGIYIQANGQHFLIDGGSSDVNKVGEYRILPFLKARGVKKLDGIFISHMDDDHVNGVMELLEITAQGEYDIQALYLTNHDKLRIEYKEILSLAEQAGVEVALVQRGSFLKGENFLMTCLYPSSQEEGEDKNSLSQVWHLAYKDCSFLFTGDLDLEGEKRLLDKGISPVQVLKVGHHGSKGSSGEEFLQALYPKIGIISAGENNRYGHPAKETINRLEKVGARMYSTIESGAVMVCTDGKEVEVRRFRKW